MKTKSLLSVLLAFIVILTLFSSCKSESNAPSVSPTERKSTEEKLREQFPYPGFGEVEINVYSNSGYLSAYISGTSESQYAEYIAYCKQFGYTIEMSESDSPFKAYNKDGYSIEVRGYSDWIDVTIDPPKEMDTIRWPKSEIASLIPVPKSKTGSVEYDSSDYFGCYIGNTTIDEFNKYVDECYDSGFCVDYERDEDEFVGYNADGYELGLQYVGFNTISICIEAPEEAN